MKNILNIFSQLPVLLSGNFKSSYSPYIKFQNNFNKGFIDLKSNTDCKNDMQNDLKLVLKDINLSIKKFKQLNISN